MRERLEEALRQLAAEFLNREATHQSMITVTRAEVADNQRTALIFISVFPDQFEAEALEFANRRRSDFATYFKKHVRASMPHVEFRIDAGEKNRRRLDELTP